MPEAALIMASKSDWPSLEVDTAKTLAARVLSVEHEILMKTERLFSIGKLGVDGTHVHVL